ncbi:ent-kaur-16-ene synthase, chloroplastic-like, partial [Prunus avium]|uniref:Ent-kaur-16-ene synthase, chloroplastic-like n=1 Tax=Prunus avium TaxID=42229 RepID=A0A6P5TTE3_PRUAV
SGKFLLPQAASTVLRLNGAAESNTAVFFNQNFEGTKERIKKMFNKVDLSVSSYDTAWVAMVPSPNSTKDPFFPECVNWLLANQFHDGSWGPKFHPLLIKDALLSTLACILALKRWSVGEEQINKGLHFIESNLASATDEEQQSPVGFNIIFPAMIESAMNFVGEFPQISPFDYLKVDDALKFPFYASLGRLSSRRAIKSYNTESTRILKSSYSCLNIGNEDFLKLAVEDFNICQSIHHKELYHLARWVVENRLDKLKFSRQKQACCYFSAAANLFPPELSDARMSWAKNGVLTTVVDDFTDVGGSEEELVNLIQLIEKWDVNASVDCCSEHVEIIFSAFKNTINEIGVKAFVRQGRSVTSDIIETWLDLLKSGLKEAEWLRNKSVPTMEEYMTNGYISIGIGQIVLPALYFVGHELSEEVVGSSELHELYRLMSTCGRLLNDIQGFKRDSAEGKLNALSLTMIRGNGVVTEEEAINEINSIIKSKRGELLRLVLQETGSIVPRACKDLVWNMSKVLHFFYTKDDGFSANEMMQSVNAVTEEPIILSELQYGNVDVVDQVWRENNLRLLVYEF